MEYNTFLQKCSDDDVLELGNQMVKLSKLRASLKIKSIFHHSKDALLEIAKYVTLLSLNEGSASQLFNGNGVDANMLCIGSPGWKKGKLKINITLEFCPDEPEIEELIQINDVKINQHESPLNNIRWMMNRNN